jgi:uncharacterized protein YbjQ (UPF0145 family)
MFLRRVSAGRMIVRVVEAVLALWIIKDAPELFAAGKSDAAIHNTLLAVGTISVVEATIWLVPRVVDWAEKKWQMSAGEVLFRGIQVIIVATMIADAASWLIAGVGFGVNHAGCALAIVVFEGIIRRFVRPDPRSQAMSHALASIQSRVTVFTHMPADKVRETLGLVRGISDIEASSKLDFELAEQEALYSMLKQALELDANAVVDARLTTGTYETNGSQWQVSRPVYTGTAVRIEPATGCAAETCHEAALLRIPRSESITAFQSTVARLP